MADPSDQCRVVVCDDVTAYRKLICMLLGLERGMEVVGEAGNGFEAVEAARRVQPDIVLLDVAMPDMDGLEALPLILEAAPDTRVLMLSGFSNADIKARAAVGGAWRFIEKGVMPDELVAHIREACAAPAVA